MTKAELTEKKRVIIQKIELIEDEWIIDEIAKLLNLKTIDSIELSEQMKERNSGESKK